MCSTISVFSLLTDPGWPLPAVLRLPTATCCKAGPTRSSLWVTFASWCRGGPSAPLAAFPYSLSCSILALRACSLLEVVSALTVRSILAPVCQLSSCDIDHAADFCSDAQNDAMAVLSGGISGGSSGDGDSKDKEVASAAAAEFAVLRLSYLESSLQRARPGECSFCFVLGLT